MAETRAISSYTFDEATAEIERLAEELKRNPLAIERNAELYERAVLLTRHAKQRLKDVNERRVAANEQLN